MNHFSRIRRTVLAMTVSSLLFLPMLTLAATGNTCGALSFIPSISIPGTEFVAGEPMVVDCTTIGKFIVALYTFGVYAGSIAAAIMVMVGGFLWLTAGGNSGQIGSAKTYMTGALSGLVLLLGSWVLLNTINTNLVRFRPLDIQVQGQIALSSNKCKLYTLGNVPIPEDEQTWSQYIRSLAGYESSRLEIVDLPPDTEAEEYVVGRLAFCSSRKRIK